MKQSLLSLGVCFLLSAAGCAGAPAAKPTTETGTVAAALSAVGADGATYSIPAGNFIFSQATVAGSSTTTCDAVAGTPTQTTSLPAATYTFYLNSACSTIPADAGTGVPFTLTRTGDGGPTAVSALLMNPVQTMNVTAGSSLSLVFQFTLENLGTLTMSTGNVTTSISVDASVNNVPPSKGALVQAVSAVSFAAGTADAGVSAVSALLSPGDAGVTGLVTVGITNLTAFAPNTANQACATFVPVVTAPLSPGYIALAQELSAAGASGSLCFADPNNAIPNGLQINIGRVGLPVTSAFTAALEPADAGATAFIFSGSTSALTPTTIYNGSTIALAPLAVPLSVIVNVSNFLVSTASGTPVGSARFTASPTTLSLAP